MHVLEKILEEIETARQEPLFRLCDYSYKDRQERIINRIEDIIRSHIDDGGWIPVEEHGLPEKDGWYQCTCFTPGIWEEPIVRELYFRKNLGEFVDNIRYGENGHKDIEKYFWTKHVTAWKELPKPYMKEV